MIEVGGLVVHPDVVSHPLLGDAHVIEHAGAPITAMSAIDWSRPARIPTIAEPGRLPRGSGTLLLNEIAVRAERAGIAALRYAGPYPTPALFRSLARSFRTSASEDAFCADVLGRALRVARDEIAVDFAPAPFTRQPHARGFLDRRDDHVDRIAIDAIVFDREPTPGSLARLVGADAVLVFGDVVWTRIATIDDRGIADGPHAVPAAVADVLGKQFPPALRDQFAELVADAVPAPLAKDARDLVLARTLAWADLGARAAARDATGFTVHAGFWTHLAPRGLAPLALAVADALATVVTAAILDELTR